MSCLGYSLFLQSMLEPEKKVTYTLQITDGGSRPLVRKLIVLVCSTCN